MKALADRRARIARVRQVQHLHAVSAAAQAEGKVVQLEGNAERLRGLRDSLSATAGPISAASLASSAELGSRLDQVRSGLSDSIVSARLIAAAKAGERRDAHIARESAERLEGRAVAQLQQMIEDRMLAGLRPRNDKGSRRG
ncbi:hypothetical protein [Sphingomonas nostoxanthinifaciens]|uniref:hypothetical protein n=1 Tax=Sphingomonas nostoxanthinifaciens TaxID=2872652 RepID=UPI001CC1FF85|nr:hypothetical protein [Sphingomonas nostoxanthinifaciens]UAK26031.1 hypothetical protein K8P63_07945 [Sphingomonas nostoxanthinifaciens]